MLYRRYFKRPLDVVGAAIGVMALSPLMALVAILIWLDDGLPIIFRQQRIGLDGNTFTMYKYRSMPRNTPELTSPLGRKMAVTRIGRVIRRLSIDELPQLYNVLQGDMSLVGPRPILVSMDKLIALRRKYGVLRFRPGLTGHAQLLGHDAMTEEEKALLDKQYCDDVTLRRDCSLMLYTIPYLFRTPPAD